MSKRHITSLALQANREGDLWYRVDGGPLECAPHGVDAFGNGELLGGFSSDRLRVRNVYVSAMPANARLILHLYRYAHEHVVEKAYLVPLPKASKPYGSFDFPRSFDKVDERKVVQTLLSDNKGYMPSLGGRRELSWADVITHSLVVLLQSGRTDTEDLQSVAQAHPAWPALTFAPTCDTAMAARLLILISDPRWYVDPNKPDASKRLTSAFGLGREGLSNMLSLFKPGRKPSGRNIEAAGMVLYTWYCGNENSAAQNAELAKSFPWCMYHTANDPVEGLLRASRIFLKFVCDVWLDHLTESRVYSWTTTSHGEILPKMIPAKRYSPQLFVPEHHFGDDELIRWREHVDNWRNAHWMLLKKAAV